MAAGRDGRVLALCASLRQLNMHLLGDELADLAHIALEAGQTSSQLRHC